MNRDKQETTSVFVTSNEPGQNKASREQYVPLRIDESDRVLAQAMSSLPTAERDKIIEEVHGVSKPIEETADFVSQKLAALESEISIKKNDAYEIALTQNRVFVEDSGFQLMFLRSEGFVASAASIRMMQYLKLKQKYFGEERITKHINFLDLSEDDKSSLETGAIQVLPEKDRSGRAVVAVLPSLWNHQHTPENRMRASYLLEMSLLQDIDVQKRGVVYIYYDTKPYSSGLSAPDAAMVSFAKTHKASMPVRYAAYHICLRDRSGYHSIGHAISKKEDIVKGISHYGDDKECRLKLQGFGIPVSCFPINSEGAMNIDAHFKWVQEQKENIDNTAHRRRTRSTEQSFPAPQENYKPGYGMDVADDSDDQMVADSSQEPASDEATLARAAQMAPRSALQPVITDVVFGRGRWFQYFPGNILFREFLEERDAEYNGASRSDKVNMTKNIVADLKGSGRRFLKLERNQRGDDIWTEVNDKEIYKKVSQCYRTVRKKDKN
ncbi:unnamed protein product [Cylindrotheca closterium]|uniref:DUF6824 domain-containing protein n=1 Tax=Cylindrotheca closterium TaxID=2856 RepID=A0AAD2FNE3_9STRA|nr:unnamed protein product [Cylindrotheca closterium]